ncbi:MAG: hypothetical protein KKF12_06760 [Proteobacteria bacterium]|nr:hypothetical protein [Desulfobacula sp.]MBU4130502.1 hypothetical protein [Pseudomonadota bacterium]
MVDALTHFYFSIDAFLILFYRFTDIAIADYMIGTFCLSMMAVVLGELTVSLALRFNKKYLDQLSERMNRKEALSIEAYERGDMAGYKGLNKQATDAWGRKFFAMMGHSAAILWPIPFALGWMQTRFTGVDFEILFPFSLITDSVGYTFSFFPIYVLSRIVFGHMRPFLPYFSSVHKGLLAAAGAPKH